MNKKVLYTLSTAFLLSGLTACNNGTDEGAMGNRNNDTVRPIGYYSDENVNRSYGRSYGNDNGNAILPERDNDGPITEMLDRNNGNNNGTFGRGVGNNTGNRDNGTNGNNGNNRNNGIFGRDVRNNIGTRDDGVIDNSANGNNRGTGTNYGTTGRNVNTRDNTTLPNNHHFSRGDYNYHGQMAGRDNNARSSYTNNYNGGLAEQISNRVEKVNNVDDVRTIVNGDEILVAVDTNDRNNRQVETQVKNAVRELTKGKDVRVVTDENIFTRARNIDNELRDGGPTDNLDADVRDMFRELRNDVNDAIR
ncbi:YhcN/YlaJ family sporulation lipoprotein [Bacillus suaedaesalsae]|uniref:YhcN/YlaJ family sporulation lipoprotein n=1 Tax=Bacillus suaedaesalsae TaxID=2810349 RepID=A0ABS2DMM5_9BACI|nr:YhcN/YlaJ family sporulation lipoprotein [Bacillus suaedaesalsae]MBM6619727.1 YhcN/YlaJ family sporulation lipoprotein [Bacillus suaedaesalsae]